MVWERLSGAYTVAQSKVIIYFNLWIISCAHEQPFDTDKVESIAMSHGSPYLLHATCITMQGIYLLERPCEYCFDRAGNSYFVSWQSRIAMYQQRSKWL